MKTYRRTAEAIDLDNKAKAMRTALTEAGFTTRRSPNGGGLMLRVFRNGYICSVYLDQQGWKVGDSENEALREQVCKVVEEVQCGT